VSTEVRAPLAGRLRTAHWVAIDAAVVVAWVAVTGGGTAHALDQRVPGPFGVVIALALAPPLVVRRLWPLPVFGVVLAGSTAFALVAGARYPYFELALATYSVAARIPGRAAVAALGVALGAISAGVMLGPREGSDTGSAAGLLVSSVVLDAAAWTLGSALRQQRLHSERLRALAAREAVSQERLRIARELHDIVAHGMSMIAVQAGVANYVVDENPEEARRVLASIEETSRTGLQELRYMLAVLRADDAPDTDRQSAPGLADLDTLVSRFRDAGLPVRVDLRGVTRRLPPAIDQSLYRIAQEALTNVVKHAGQAEAEVVLDFQPGAVVIQITDDGRRAGSAGSAGSAEATGHGILGMRERVAVFGGKLAAGPLPPPEVGFRVSALLPVAEAGT
jgi:signal transduction histidine kinase